MSLSILSSALIFLLLISGGLGRHAHLHQLPPLREQAEIQDGWLKERLEGIPNILQKHRVDAWLVSVTSASIARIAKNVA